MLNIEYTAQFKRDIKKSKKRNHDIEKLRYVMRKIEIEEELELKYKDHVLTGNWQHHRECHLDFDWLLIYKIIPNEKTVIFTRTGTHSDLFN